MALRYSTLAELSMLFLSVVPGWTQDYTISTIAGGAPPPTPAVATASSIGEPRGVATDAVGNTYFASLHCIFKIDRNGVLTRVAGTSRPGFSGDGGPAVAAQIFGPAGLTFDTEGNLYFADQINHRVRRVSPGGTISTVAGNGKFQYAGDGGPATIAGLSSPRDVAVDFAGNLYIADVQRVRRVTPGGIISTVAGNGTVGDSGDGGPATGAQLWAEALAVDAVGNIYIADSYHNRIRRVTPGGIITTVAGNGTAGNSGDGGPATAAQLSYPAGLEVDLAGNLYISDTDNHRIRRVTPGGVITTVVGNGRGGYSGDGGPALAAQLYYPSGLAMDAAGSLYISDSSNRIRRVTASGLISTVAGNGTLNYSGDGGPAIAAQSNASGVAVDAAGNIYISEPNNPRIRRVTPDGIITTVAGNGTPGDSGDGGPAAGARLNGPLGLAADAAGNLYIADTARIWRVTPGGIITSVAGNGALGYSGDGGPASGAQLNYPMGLAMDGVGNLYIADSLNYRIRRVTPGGIITTVAGNGTEGYSGDGGLATAAQISSFVGIAADGIGNLYLADANNSRLRRVTPDGIISTFVSSASGIDPPTGVALGADGNLFVSGIDRVWRVTPDRNIVLIAGNGTNGYSGDGGPATSAQLYDAYNVAVDKLGRVLIAQQHVGVRALTPISSPCIFAVSPTNLAASAVGGPFQVSIQTTAACSWSVSGLPPWIAASATTGSGPATLTLTIGANSSGVRSATITVAGTVIKVDQAAAETCTFGISPGGQVFSSAPGTGSIAVSTQSGCAWTASSALAWASITSGASGTGSGTVSYQVASNAFGTARSGTMTVAGRPFNLEQLGAVSAGLISAGSMAHIASGGGWKTTFTLVNNGAAAAQFGLLFTSDTGTELTLPLTFPQSGTGPLLASVLERTLNPGATLIIECEGPATQDTQQGAAQLLSNGAISGFAVFRQRIGDTEQEAVVPLETRIAAGYVLPFDNTSGVQTGVAVTNLAPQTAALGVVIKAETGAELMSTTLNLVSRGHTAFVLTSLYALTAQRRGTIEFRPPAGGQISVLGLRFSPKGAVTTIPVLVK